MADSEERVVVMAVDSSSHSEYAFQWYIDNFHLPQNKVILVTCPEYNIGASDVSPGRIEAELQEVTAKADILKTKFLSKMSERGVNGEFAVLQDNKPAHAIVEFAKQKNADLIVTGTRGLGKVRRTILGSVSDYIIHHSEVPVLVCRHK